MRQHVAISVVIACLARVASASRTLSGTAGLRHRADDQGFQILTGHTSDLRSVTKGLVTADPMHTGESTASTPAHHEETHGAANHVGHEINFGMDPVLYAFVFGILSGLSLPIGSCLGYLFSPVRPLYVALMMAFGAGALLFAVTVELYGHALREVQEGHMGLMEMYTIVFGALCGAAFYLTSNKWLAEHFSGEGGDCPKPQCSCGHVFDFADSEFCRKCGTTRPEEDHEDPRRPVVPQWKRKRPVCGCGHIFDRKDSKFCRKCGSAKPINDADEALVGEMRKQYSDGAEVAEASEPQSRRASWQQKWKKAGQAVIHAQQEIRIVHTLNHDDLRRVRGREKAVRALHSNTEHAKSVAFALFLGLLVDGVPEGVLMGFLSAEGHLTPVFLVSLFVANFPESFSSTSLLVEADMPFWKVFSMWTGLCLLVGCLCGISCYVLLLYFPSYSMGGHDALPVEVRLGVSMVEGVTGGAMIACIAAVMLPEAFESAGKHGPGHGVGPFWQQSGFACVAGFLLSVALKAMFG